MHGQGNILKLKNLYTVALDCANNLHIRHFNFISILRDLSFSTLIKCEMLGEREKLNPDIQSVADYELPIPSLLPVKF